MRFSYIFYFVFFSCSLFSQTGNDKSLTKAEKAEKLDVIYNVGEPLYKLGTSYVFFHVFNESEIVGSVSPLEKKTSFFEKKMRDIGVKKYKLTSSFTLRTDDELKEYLASELSREVVVAFYYEKNKFQVERFRVQF